MRFAPLCPELRRPATSLLRSLTTNGVRIIVSSGPKLQVAKRSKANQRLVKG
jgi:hypothetical protein